MVITHLTPPHLAFPFGTAPWWAVLRCSLHLRSSFQMSKRSGQARQPSTKTSSGRMSLCSDSRWSSISSPTSSELWHSHTGIVVVKGSGLR